MKRILYSVIGVLACAAVAVAQNSKAELTAAASADLVVLDASGKLVPFEPAVSPEFYVVYYSASW
jgi:ABC-type molybdate transport system substrate-binding protein